MAGALNRVLRSINNDDRTLCVDIFRRPDASFGYEAYRRDVEDPRGWFPIGGFEAKVYRSEAEALDAAKASVAWLADVLEDGG